VVRRRVATRGGLWAALALLVACSGTESTPPPDAPAFAGTIFARRWSDGANPVEAPLAFDGYGRERLIPLDLSPYYPEDGPEFFQFVIEENWDVSPDGKYMYVAVYGKLIRFDLPGGGPLRELIDPFNTSNVRVSPTGHMLAFQRPQFGDETYVLNASGTAPQRILPPNTQAGTINRRPVWAGPGRVLVAQETLLPSGPEMKVLEMRHPDWAPVELVALRDRPVFGLPWGLYASPDGSRLFMVELGDSDSSYMLVEYDSVGGGRRIRILWPPNMGWRVILSPDATQVVSPSDSGLVVYDIETGQRVAGPFGKPGRTEVPVAWTAAEYPE
jgi:hypothetical protein